MDDLATTPDLEARFQADMFAMADAMDAHTTPTEPEPEPTAEDGGDDGGEEGDSGEAEVEAEAAPERVYATVAEWVDDWLAITIDRRVSDVASEGARWCPWWWSHPEALNRIYLLWQTWESARTGDSMPEWWSHFDDVWAKLTSENGPFRDCRPARLDGDRVTDPARHDGHDAHRAELLPCEPVPTDLLQHLPEGVPPSVH